MKRSHRASTSTILSLALVLSTIVCTQSSVRPASTGRSLGMTGLEQSAETSTSSSGCSHPGCEDQGTGMPAPSACCLTWAPAVPLVTFAPPIFIADPRLSLELDATRIGMLSAAAQSVRPAWGFPPGVSPASKPLLRSTLLGRAPPLA